MYRLTHLFLPVLAPVMFLPSCTLAISKLSKPVPQIPKGATTAQVHQLLGEPHASQKLAPPIPLAKDPVLHKTKGTPLSLRNDRRPIGLREEFLLKGRYRKSGDPDGTGGLANMSARAYWIPEIALGPFATLEWLAHPRNRAKVIVWYSPQGKEVYTWQE